MKKAHLIANIPPTRFHSIDGSTPKIGDVVVLDQGFTFPDGEPGALVYCMGQCGEFRWQAEVYASEIGPDIAA
jgi:hypothetical protein